MVSVNYVWVTPCLPCIIGYICTRINWRSPKNTTTIFTCPCCQSKWGNLPSNQLILFFNSKASKIQIDINTNRHAAVTDRLDDLYRKELVLANEITREDTLRKGMILWFCTCILDLFFFFFLLLFGLTAVLLCKVRALHHATSLNRLE